MFSPFLEKISKENKRAILLGDFNVDLLKYNSNSHVTQFLQLLGSHSFLQQRV